MRSRITSADLVDLHTHSIINDGNWRPEALAAAAAEAGIRVVALTDHDTLAGAADFGRAAAVVGIQALPGVEVSSWWEGTIYHVLLYGVDVRHPVLTDLLSAVWRAAVDAAARARDDLRGRGYSLPQLEELSGGREPLPYHVLVAALRSGLGASFNEVVRFTAGELGLSFAAGVDMAAAVHACHAAGGVAVLAHPGRAEFGFQRADPETAKRMVRETHLDGVEVYHWSHGPTEIAAYDRLAQELGLLVSCGSDSHGPRSAHRLRGWEAGLCRALLQRCGVEVVDASGACAGGNER